MNWALTEIDSSLGRLNGHLHIEQGPGLLQNVSRLASSSSAAKIPLIPLIALQNAERLGIIKTGLPDLSRLSVSRIDGDYSFKNGIMTIETFEISGPELSIGAKGNVDLAPGALTIDVTMQSPKPTLLGETQLKFHVGGTLANPKTNLESLKKVMFKATIKNLDKLKSLFH
jgi:uncharacterized protein YhdP